MCERDARIGNEREARETGDKKRKAWGRRGCEGLAWGGGDGPCWNDLLLGTTDVLLNVVRSGTKTRRSRAELQLRPYLAISK